MNENVESYGLMTYTDTWEGTNIGDYIQSLAAAQYLPSVDTLINREQLDLYNASPVKLIMNGWFTHYPEHWIPSSKINPLFIAFHVNASMKDRILSKEGINYLKKHQPIGCRDKYTTQILQSLGIDAYFSGCLTLTLDNKYKAYDYERTDEIIIVDPIFNVHDLKYHFKSPINFLRAVKHNLWRDSFKRSRLLNSLIDKRLKNKSINIHHMMPPNQIPDSKRFEIAENLLKKYARAKLVITSRIHCALPCLALGTPVVFINSFYDESNKSRLDGILELFNRVDVDLKTGEYTSNFPLDNGKISENVIIDNPNTYQLLTDRLKEDTARFVLNSGRK